MGGFGPGSSGGFDGAEGRDFGGGLGGPFFGPSTMPGFSPGYGMRPYDMGKNFKKIPDKVVFRKQLLEDLREGRFEEDL